MKLKLRFLPEVFAYNDLFGSLRFILTDTYKTVPMRMCTQSYSIILLYQKNHVRYVGGWSGVAVKISVFKYG
jgi:hypothetical protein